MEDSPKSMSPLSDVDVRNSGEDKEANKRKCQYIVAITRGAVRANLSSNGTMKRKITEMFPVHKKDRSALMKTLDRPMIRFLDSNKVGRTPNEIFPLVIIIMTVQFDASQILIDINKSYDIVCFELFEKMGLDRRNLWSYEGLDL